MSASDAFSTFPRVPLVPFPAFELARRLRGRYPEALFLELSALVGQKLLSHRTARIWSEAGAGSRTAASICNHTAAWLWWYLTKKRPRVVVEFGTGYSTAVFGAFARSGGQRSTVLSLEHDPEWYAFQSKHLVELIAGGHVQLSLCPLERQSLFDRDVLVYGGIDRLLDGKADMVFVDGPAASRNGGAGREGSLLQAIQITRDGGLILVHDALRADEFNLIRQFEKDKRLGFRCKGIVPLWYGLAVCEKRYDPTCSG